MGVLVEMISVVVPEPVLRATYPGGAAQYGADCPNGTFCSDGHLTRIGFMSPEDVRTFVDTLQSHGLTLLRDGTFTDIAIIDQMVGPTSPCPWLDCARHPAGFGIAWLRGSAMNPIAFPRGWSADEAARVQFFPSQEAAGRMLLMAEEPTADVFLDYETGREVYVGRVRGFWTPPPHRGRGAA